MSVLDCSEYPASLGDLDNDVRDASVATANPSRTRNSDPMYLRIWEYDVTADHVDDFIAAYGADGDWAQLFRHGTGYLGTELFRDTDDDSRFVTVDRWADEQAWRAFLEERGETYAGLDARLVHLSASQRSLLEGTA
jgi:heme-degrading monooxygenase HmoA